MAKKAKRVTAKKIVAKRTVKVAKQSVGMSKNTLVALMIGLAVVVGAIVYYKSAAVPTDVMVVAQPNTFSFLDKFGDGKIAKGSWVVAKSDDVTVNETTGDNLRINIPSGANAGKVRNAFVTYREAVSDSKDFAFNARVYKPMVDGNGVGRAGLRFAGGEGDESEGLQLYWEVGANSSELVFVVNAGGSNVKTQRVSVNGSQIQLLLSRSGAEYVASYRINNFDDDNPFEQLGESVVSSSQTGGKLRLFATNVGNQSNYPKVIARFDSASGWTNRTVSVQSDNFSPNGALDASMWSVAKKGQVDVDNKNGNLVMHLAAVTTRPENQNLTASSARVVSSAEISKDKKGVALVEMIKPNVAGGGTGIVGLSFNSESDKNDESASIRWVVAGDSSKLVFAVRNANGKVVERESVNLGKNRNRVTLRLMHGDGRYTAQYRLGPGLDDDTGFKTLGSEANPRLGAKGAFSLFTTHTVVGNIKAPEVTAKFDSFRVNYY
jgi:hypothetical protein